VDAVVGVVECLYNLHLSLVQDVEHGVLLDLLVDLVGMGPVGDVLEDVQEGSTYEVEFNAIATADYHDLAEFRWFALIDITIADASVDIVAGCVTPMNFESASF